MLGMMAGVLYLTQSEAIDLAGFNMFAVRFLELAAFVRVLARREFPLTRWTKIDQAVVWLYLYTAIVYWLRASEEQANVMGRTADALLCYFAFRGLIADMPEFQWFLRSLVVLLLPYVSLILVESLTHHNLFSFMGGAYNWVRDERFRCVGSFRHPDLLGTFGACFLPLYVGLARIRLGRALALIGVVLCLVIVWASNSGGPVCATVVAAVGWLFWRMRTRMRAMRWGMAAAIALTAMVMKAPVWYLIARLSLIAGGTGWHRAYLMDMAFQHLDKWWLCGMRIEATSDWFPYTIAATGGADITNEFIAFGLSAGLGAVALSILLLVRGFSGLGEALANVRSNAAESSETEFVLWGLGVMLAVHVISWLGITYFDQFYVVWFLQLAAISSLSEICVKAGSAIETQEAAGHPEDVDLIETELGYENPLP